MCSCSNQRIVSFEASQVVDVVSQMVRSRRGVVQVERKLKIE